MKTINVDGQEIDKQKAVGAIQNLLDALVEAYGMLKLEELAMNVAVDEEMSEAEFKMKSELFFKVKDALEEAGWETFD